MINNFQTCLVERLLTLDTVAYASGDVLFDTLALVLNSKDPFVPRRGRVRQITLIDTDAAKGLLDLVFFTANVPLGTVNAAVSLTDAAAANVIAVVSVNAYTDLLAAGNAVARPSFDAIEFNLTDANPVSLFVAGISRDAKTYTANGLRLRAVVEIDNIDQF